MSQPIVALVSIEILRQHGSAASGLVAAIAGLYGKSTPAGQKILDLRANIRSGPNTPPAPNPNP